MTLFWSCWAKEAVENGSCWVSVRCFRRAGGCREKRSFQPQLTCFPGKSGDEDHSLYTQLFEQVFELVQNDSDSSNQHLVTAQFVEVSQEVYMSVFRSLYIVSVGKATGN